MQTNINTPPKNWDRRGLPTWTYKGQGLFDIELKKIFRTHWQLVCHQSDIPDRGSYSTFDVGGDRALIIRGNDDKIRAFHNLCRHRGSRVVGAPNGRCKHVITCPFHGCFTQRRDVSCGREAWWKSICRSVAAKEERRMCSLCSVRCALARRFSG